MENKIYRFMEQHQLTLQGKTILVGVSGGPDSMALLHFLQGLKTNWNLKVVAISIDHQLRGVEAEADIAYVNKMCNKWNIPFVTARVDVRKYEKTHKLSTQVAARKLRYKVFEEQMNAYTADFLALGHHGDDQVETLLMALVRTTNLNSLTGIPVTRTFASGEIIRPLLAVTKKEIEQYCKKHHIQPRMDNTNLDTSYTRNYFRKFIVPKVKERHPHAHMTMQHLSESLQEDESYLKMEAKKVFKQVVTWYPHDLHQPTKNERKAELSIEALKLRPVPLQRRVYRLILDYLYDDLPKQLTYVHEQIFLTLLEEPTNKVVHFPQGLLIERSYNDLLFYFRDITVRDSFFEQKIDSIPNRVTLPNGAILSISYLNERDVLTENNHAFICGYNELSFPLTVRTRKPGDRMHVKGMTGTKKIKDILIDDKIPRAERESIFLIEDNEKRIFWLIGVREGMNIDRTEPSILFEYVDDDQYL